MFKPSNKLYSCRICKKDDFLYNQMHWNAGYAFECKKCFSNRWKEFRKTIEGKRHTRNKRLKNKYGITINDYEQMLKDQNNSCLICKDEFSDTIKPDVDHHHSTRKVRGILCHTCNLALGYLREDEDIIWNMLEYLKKTMWSKMENADVQTIN